MKPLRLILICLLLVGLRLNVIECFGVRPCSPALDGYTNILICAGRGLTGRLYWTSHNVSGVDQIISQCSREVQGKHDCKNYSPQNKPKANINTINNFYLSMLVFSATSIADDGQVIKCIAQDELEDDNMYTLSSCTMSVYLVPSSPACQAKAIENGGVLVKCSIFNVYPDFRCEMFTVGRNETKLVDPTIIEHLLFTTGKKEPYFAECTAVVFLPHTEGFKFLVNVYPKVPGFLAHVNPIFNSSGLVMIQQGKEAFRKPGNISVTMSSVDRSTLNSATLDSNKAETQTISKEIIDANLPIAKLEDLNTTLDELTGKTSLASYFQIFPIVNIDDSPLCLDYEGFVTLTCKAVCFPSRPEFQWIIENITSIDITQEFEFCTNDQTTYVSRHKIYPQNPSQIGMITCQATVVEKETLTKLHFMDSKDIFLIDPPSQPPEFKDQSGKSLGKLSDIPFGADIDMQCVARPREVGNVGGDTVSVKCRNEDHTKLLLDLTNKDGSVTFTVHGTPLFNNSHCKCTVLSDHQCHGSEPVRETLVITVSRTSMDDLRVDSTEESKNRSKKIATTYDYYYVASVIFVLSIIFAIVLIVYLRRRGGCSKRSSAEETRYQNVGDTEAEIPMVHRLRTAAPLSIPVSQMGRPTPFDNAENGYNAHNMAATGFSAFSLQPHLRQPYPDTSTGGYFSPDITYDSPRYETLSSIFDSASYVQPEDVGQPPACSQSSEASTEAPQSRQGLSLDECVQLSGENTPLMSQNNIINNNNNNSNDRNVNTDSPAQTEHGLDATPVRTAQQMTGDEYIAPVSPQEYYMYAGNHQ